METAKKEIEIVEVRGIPYFIDKQNRVYKHETIFTPNPIIIGEWNPQLRSIQFTVKTNEDRTNQNSIPVPPPDSAH